MAYTQTMGSFTYFVSASGTRIAATPAVSLCMISVDPNVNDVGVLASLLHLKKLQNNAIYMIFSACLRSGATPCHSLARTAFHYL
jgi:hypothetical protein